MYVGLLLMLIGEAVFFQSLPISIYTLVVFTGFNIFIIYFEEPRLKKAFGKEYTAYLQRIRRWI